MTDIKVQVRVHGAAQMSLGWKKQTFTLPEEATAADMISQLSRMEPSVKHLLEGEEHNLSSLILINSSDIKKGNGLQTKLSDGDIVDIVSIISGG